MVATGRLTTFPASSKYQLIVDAIAPAGVGALMAMLEARKKALEAEGLFAAERKRALPYLPEVIGVVTSPTGAVIRDILHRLRERFPRQVLLWPVTVQGERCAPEVAAAIRGFNALAPGGPVPRPDVHHRGARRRLDRGPLGVQRGDRGAGGGREPDPADLGGRARDRHDADRLRRRPAGADADRGGRDGGAGAARAAGRRWRGSRSGGGARWRAGSGSGGSGCATSRAGCRGRRRCSGSGRSGSTGSACGCRGR